MWSYHSDGVQMTALEILQSGKPAPAHLDLIKIDVASKDFFRSPLLESVISMEAQTSKFWPDYRSLTDSDLEELSQSEHLKNLQWLSLIGHQAITKEGVRAICRAIQAGRFDLIWLDLEDTEYYHATPYHDAFVVGYGESFEGHWRIGTGGYEMLEEFGHQRWLTAGRRLEDTMIEVIDIKDLRPDRFSLK